MYLKQASGDSLSKKASFRQKLPFPPSNHSSNVINPRNTSKHMGSTWAAPFVSKAVIMLAY